MSEDDGSWRHVCRRQARWTQGALPAARPGTELSLFSTVRYTVYSTVVGLVGASAGLASLDSQKRRKSSRLALHQGQRRWPPAKGDSGPAVKTFRTGVISDHLPGWRG